jgi:hypothetical protein
MNLQEQILRIKQVMGILSEDDNMIPCGNPKYSNTNMDFKRPSLDLKKLVDVGAVFVTLAIDGDSKSKTYKKRLEGEGNSIITLYNYECDDNDGWIRYSVDNYSVEPTEMDQSLLDTTYEGKYEQIYWSLNKLGYNVDDFIKDKSTDVIKEGYVDFPIDDDIRLEVWEDDDKIELNSLVLPPDMRSSGKGTEIMNMVIDYANSKGKSIYLTPDVSFGGTSIMSFR